MRTRNIFSVAGVIVLLCVLSLPVQHATANEYQENNVQFEEEILTNEQELILENEVESQNEMFPYEDEHAVASEQEDLPEEGHSQDEIYREYDEQPYLPEQEVMSEENAETSDEIFLDEDEPLAGQDTDLNDNEEVFYEDNYPDDSDQERPDEWR